VRDARRDDRQDVARACAASVEPGEEPVLAADHQASELALSAVVGGFDVPVFEKEQQAWPLPVHVAEALAERRRCAKRDREVLPAIPSTPRPYDLRRRLRRMATPAIATAPANMAPPPHLQMPTNETLHVELELGGAGLLPASPARPSGMPQSLYMQKFS
jgi:hypothetical protein